MGGLFLDLQERLLPELRRGHLSACRTTIADVLQRLPPSPFHCATELSFTNPPQLVGAHFGAFLFNERQRGTVAAAYTEMNGFDINPGRWFFDVFAYSHHGGHASYDWLSEWDSQEFPDMTLTGMEKLQQAYGSRSGAAPEHQDAFYVAGLLVVVAFQSLIQAAAAYIKPPRAPILVSAHDYDFIFEVPSA